MKRLLIVGASILQLPAIMEAKKMGLCVGVADYDPNAVGIPYADEYFNVSTIDEIGVCENAKKIWSGRYNDTSNRYANAFSVLCYSEAWTGGAQL